MTVYKIMNDPEAAYEKLVFSVSNIKTKEKKLKGEKFKTDT